MDSLILGLRVLISLAAVLGLMWLLHRRLRRGAGPARAKAMTVVSRQGVGPKAAVVLVETEGRRFLLGVTEHGINVLHATEVMAAEAPALEAVEASAPTPLATRRAARHAAVFDRELRTELGRGELSAREPYRAALARGELARASTSAQSLAGSILDLGTWRQAAFALRAGRRR